MEESLELNLDSIVNKALKSEEGTDAVDALVEELGAETFQELCRQIISAVVSGYANNDQVVSIRVKEPYADTFKRLFLEKVAPMVPPELRNLFEGCVKLTQFLNDPGFENVTQIQLERHSERAGLQEALNTVSWAYGNNNLHKELEELEIMFQPTQQELRLVAMVLVALSLNEKRSKASLITPATRAWAKEGMMF